MINKPRNRIQQQIMEVLDREPASVADLHSQLPVSQVYIRQQLLQMMDADLIEKVDNRQPYIYQKKTIDLGKIQDIALYRKGLLVVKESDLPQDMKLAPVIKMIRSLPKNKWYEFAVQLETISQVIDQLNDEDKLIDTL